MRAFLAGLVMVFLVSLAPSRAEEIGFAVKVDPQVRAFPPSGAADYDLKVRDAIERGLRVQLTGKSSYLRVALKLNGQSAERSLRGAQRFSFTSTALLSGRSDVRFGDSAAPGSSTIHLLVGKLWLALVPDEPQMKVETPDAVAGVKGTYLRILVDPALGTFIAVDEGIVTVQAKAGGPAVDVPAGQSVLVPPGGQVQPPSILGPGGKIKGLGSGEEPFLDPPVLQGGDNSTEPPTGNSGGPP